MDIRYVMRMKSIEQLHGSDVLVREVSWSPDGDSWTRQIFVRRPVHGGLRQVLAYYVDPESYSGPGEVFYRAPVIVRRTRRYVIIHQSGGYDV